MVQCSLVRTLYRTHVYFLFTWFLCCEIKMPPFRTGLLKRKSDLNTNKSATNNVATNYESDSNSDSGDLLKGELNVEGDETDSEGHKSDVDSDQEQDEVLFGDEDSTLGDDEDDAASVSESSELTDSEDNDDDGESDNEGSEVNNDNDEEESEVKKGSDSESGIRQTHSSSSESDKKHNTTTTTRKKQHNKKHNTDALDRLTDSVNKTNISTQPVAHKDEYESGDTSDEEDRRNTVGDIPMWWYNEYPHVGYDLDGRRIIKPPQRDQIDDFLRKCEDPEFWRTVRDPATGQDVVLSAAELQLLARLRAGRAPADLDEHAPWLEWFTRDVLAAPLRAFPEHKRSFLPSRDEQRAVSRLVHALRMGWLKTRRQLAAERRARKERRFYDLWGSAPADEERARGVHRHIPAPRRALPSHAESYNPPPEYLLDEQEMKEWTALSETPWKRKYTFLPTRYASLRAVPAYERFTRERFLRCLDLYLAPRAIKMRLTIGPDELVPRLPSPRELRPFPTGEAVAFRGHTGAVRSCDFDPSGQYVVSGGDDGTVRVWETHTGRCLRSVALGAPVACVAWTPVAGLALLAAASGARLVLLAPGAGVGAHRVAARTDALLEEPPPAHDAAVDARTAAAARWERVAPEEWARGVRLAVTHFRPVKHVAWHARGDYVAVTLEDAAARSVLVHQVSRRRSQLPFSRSKGLVQAAVFHPTRPLLFVATQRAVRVYDLVRQELVRKLRTGAQWVSSLAVHPGGDNLVVGSYDRKVVWFDLELSGSPYRTLRLHGGAVRGVALHRRYPLLASCGDEGGAVLCHAAVFADLLQNPLLVPLRRLAVPRAGDVAGLHLVFHPDQPWLLVAAADHTLRLYT